MNLEEALLKAHERYLKRNTDTEYRAKIQFNVQRYNEEPLLAVVDYGLLAIQRIFEKGETRFYDLIYTVAQVTSKGFVERSLIEQLRSQ